MLASSLRRAYPAGAWLRATAARLSAWCCAVCAVLFPAVSLGAPPAPPLVQCVRPIRSRRWAGAGGGRSCHAWRVRRCDGKRPVGPPPPLAACLARMGSCYHCFRGGGVRGGRPADGRLCLVCDVPWVPVVCRHHSVSRASARGVQRITTRAFSGLKDQVCVCVCVMCTRVRGCVLAYIFPCGSAQFLVRSARLARTMLMARDCRIASSRTSTESMTPPSRGPCAAAIGTRRTRLSRRWAVNCTRHGWLVSCARWSETGTVAYIGIRLMKPLGACGRSAELVDRLQGWHRGRGVAKAPALCCSARAMRWRVEAVVVPRAKWLNGLASNARAGKTVAWAGMGRQKGCVRRECDGSRGDWVLGSGGVH